MRSSTLKLALGLGLRPSKNAAELIVQLYLKSSLLRLSEANGLFLCFGILDTRLTSSAINYRPICEFPSPLLRGRNRTTFSTSIYSLLSDSTIPRIPCAMGLSQLFTLQKNAWSIHKYCGREAVAVCMYATISAGYFVRKILGT